MIRRIALAGTALLGGFHVWLLARQAWSGQLAEPATVLRWLVALTLAAGLFALRRSGRSIFLGRPALVIWLLAGMLHGPALANDSDGFATPALPDAVATVAQVSIAALPSALALAALLAPARWIDAMPAHRFVAIAPLLVGRREPAGALRFLPRPPPLA